MSVISVVPVQSTLQTVFNYVASSCRIAFFMGAGDVLMQEYNGVNKSKKINWQRTLKFAAIGLCFMGPVLTYWRNSIIFIVKPTLTLKQLFWDQIYLAPCINLGLVSMSGVLEKESVRDIENRISKYFPYIIKRHYMLWPGVQFFSIICVQPTLQIGFSNFIAILWYAYISGVLHQDQTFEKPKNEQNQLMKYEKF